MTSAQEQDGWFSRNWKWAVPAVLLGLPVVLCFGVPLGIGLAMKPQLDAFGEVVKQRLQSDGAIAAHLGGTPQLTGEVAVSMKSSFLSGDGAVLSFSVPVSGPNALGRVSGNGRTTDDGPEISQISLHLANAGRPIELPARLPAR